MHLDEVHHKSRRHRFGRRHYRQAPSPVCSSPSSLQSASLPTTTTTATPWLATWRSASWWSVGGMQPQEGAQWKSHHESHHGSLFGGTSGCRVWTAYTQLESRPYASVTGTGREPDLFCRVTNSVSVWRSLLPAFCSRRVLVMVLLLLAEPISSLRLTFGTCGRPNRARTGFTLNINRHEARAKQVFGSSQDCGRHT